MKTFIILAFLLLAIATGAASSRTNSEIASSATTPAGAAEPAQLLVCGSALLMLSVAVRRFASGR
jgi:hypothetical protein